VQLETGECATYLHLYRHPDRPGRPIWTSKGVDAAPCLSYIGIHKLGAGDSIALFEERAAVSDILRDSLPAGRYRIDITFYLNDAPREISAGVVYLSR
jgi:hypothetical protein